LSILCLSTLPCDPVFYSLQISLHIPSHPITMKVIAITLAFCLLITAKALQLSMRSFSKQEVLAPFARGNALKVISGLHNFDSNLVQNVAWAATEGGATHVDIACDAGLVRAAKSVSSLPICVSSVVPSDFVAAVGAGADMIEIGNFDGFYEQGLDFSAQDVMRMTAETRSLLPSTPLSVTIPHRLSLSEQVSTADSRQEVDSRQQTRTYAHTLPLTHPHIHTYTGRARHPPRGCRCRHHPDRGQGRRIPIRHGRPAASGARRTHPRRSIRHQPRRACARYVRFRYVLSPHPLIPLFPYFPILFISGWVSRGLSLPMILSTSAVSVYIMSEKC
jgi:hypothetical protein